MPISLTGLLENSSFDHQCNSLGNKPYGILRKKNYLSYSEKYGWKFYL